VAICGLVLRRWLDCRSPREKWLRWARSVLWRGLWMVLESRASISQRGACCARPPTAATARRSRFPVVEDPAISRTGLPRRRRHLRLFVLNCNRPAAAVLQGSVSTVSLFRACLSPDSRGKEARTDSQFLSSSQGFLAYSRNHLAGSRGFDLYEPCTPGTRFCTTEQRFSTS
jgi:hypothetical protein